MIRCGQCGSEILETAVRCPACETVVAGARAGGVAAVPGLAAETILAAPSSAVLRSLDQNDINSNGLAASAGGVRHVPQPDRASGPLEVGQQFGSRYTILRELGIGGMGAVYQAWDAELNVAVALKVIRPEAAQDRDAAQDIERRFKQELLLARQVTHKNVVRIHDLGEIDGIKYITMPYIEGADLATVLRDSPRLGVPRLLAIARQIAAGLQAAHEAGVVHRDLKPANVMLEQDRAIIMDFGIARSTSRVGSIPVAQAGAAPGPHSRRRSSRWFRTSPMLSTGSSRCPERSARRAAALAERAISPTVFSPTPPPRR